MKISATEKEKRRERESELEKEKRKEKSLFTLGLLKAAESSAALIHVNCTNRRVKIIFPAQPQKSGINFKNSSSARRC